jgi:hypothetical protein
VPRTEKDLKSPLSISVGDREARTDCQCGDLIDCIAAGAPLRKLLFVEALGHNAATNTSHTIPVSQRFSCVGAVL